MDININDYEFKYILIIFLVIICFIRTIINLFINSVKQTKISLSGIEKKEINDLENLKLYLDIPIIFIIIYLLYTITLTPSVILVLSLIIISLTVDYFTITKNIYTIVNKKYINKNIIKFINKKVKPILDIIVFFIYFFILYKIFDFKSYA
jgi:hypothetical protein